MNKPTKIIEKASAMGSIRLMERKQTSVFPYRKMTENSVRKAVSRLNQQGFSFICTTTPSGMEVTRIK